MRILALTRRAPFPPDRGDRIRGYQLLRRLGEAHEVHLVSGEDEALEAPRHEALGEFCRSHLVQPLSPLRRLVGAARSMTGDRPLTLGWSHHPTLEATVRRLAAGHPFDVALVFGSSMAPYWLRQWRRSRLPAIMDFADVESERYRHYARRAHGLRRWIYAREHRQLARYEEELAERATRSVFVSEAEARLFRERVPEGVESIENGVDGGFFARPELSAPVEPYRVVFVGQMDEQANLDAVRWYADRVHSQLRVRFPQITLDVVGPNPGREVQELRGRPGIRITGWVDDVRPYLWSASVAIAPMRIDQGTQNKVLEAMAASVPVVVTPAAARGLGRSEGPHLSVAHAPHDFAEAVAVLLEDPGAARAQAHAALEFVDSHHSWDRAAARMEELLREAAAEREP